MKTLISGHRLFKLNDYDVDFIKLAIDEAIDNIINKYGIIIGYSGMASGVDLWFCRSCLDKKMSYVACIPFEEQQELVEEHEKEERLYLIDNASSVLHIRNSVMVNRVDYGIIVWDGNKGGTHNVFQQMLEHQKEFIWINPISEKLITI